jgi:hypothetical protein
MHTFIDPATPLPTEVAEAIAFLRTGKDHQYELAKALFEPETKTFFLVDLVFIGALQRSTALIDGFSTLVEQRNALAAAPLLRLQLDSAMRLNALWLVENPDAVATALLEDKPLRHIKAADGRPLTDSYLRQALAFLHPWVNPIYKRASGFIHMSASHLTSAIIDVEPESRNVHMILGPGRAWKDDEMLSAVNAFVSTTNVIYELCNEYRHSRRGLEQRFSHAEASGAG